MSNYIAFDTETESTDIHNTKILLYSSFMLGNGFVSNKYNMYLQDDLINRHVITQNGKFDKVVMKNNHDIDFWISEDTLLLQYLLHIDRPRKLEKMVKEYYNVYKKDLITIFFKSKSVNLKSEISNKKNVLNFLLK